VERKEDLKVMIIRLSDQCPFNLDLTLCCGQAFRWEKSDGWWHGVVQQKLMKVSQDGKKLRFEGTDEDFLIDYLGLNDDFLSICDEINKDPLIEAAIRQFKGLRILRQEPWECVISYICATFKNIASIKRMLLNLSRKFGEKASFHSERFFTFPSPSKLARASLNELKECELGYRATFVSQTSRKIVKEDFDLNNLTKVSYDEAKRTLLEFPGVGQKVADCVLLFGLGKLDAFPVDVWIMRALLRNYSSHFPRNLVMKVLDSESLSDSQYKQLNVFGRTYFGRYAGYAQEYLYHYERMKSKQQGGFQDS
jgi:N-glycosylase/DNA lyase